MRVKAQTSAKYELTALDGGPSPQSLRAVRKGNDLVLEFPGLDGVPDLHIEGFYEGGESELYGLGSDGVAYQYGVAGAEGHVTLGQLGVNAGGDVLLLEVPASAGVASSGFAQPLLGGAAVALGVAVPSGGAVDAADEEQSAVRAAALAAIRNAASGGTATDSTPSADTYTAAGVTGVTSANLGAINSAMNAAGGVDTVAGVQTVVNAYVSVLAAADGADGNTNAALPALSAYEAIGVTGLNSAGAALLSDVIDGKASADVNTVQKIQALAAAVQAVLGFDDPSTDTAPSAAQINTLVAGQTVGGNTLGANAVSADALAAVRAAIDAANSDGTAIASQQELAQVVQTALTAYSQALGVIAEMAEAGSATSTTPSAQTYADAGVIGVTGANLAAINQALNRAMDMGNEYGRAQDLQAIVNSCNAVLGEANGALPDASPDSDPSAGDYLNMGADIGLAETDAENLSLLNDIVGARGQTDVDTFGKIENLARIANGIQAVAAGQGGSVSPALTEVDFGRIGVVGVTANNLQALLAAIAAQADSGADTDTVGKLQAVVDTAVVEHTNRAVQKILDYAGTGAIAPSVSDYTAAGVTGVTSANLGAINSAMNAAGGVDTVAGVQAVVNAYVSVLAVADGADGNTNAALPALSAYQAIGVTGLNSAGAALLSDVIDGKASVDVNTVQKIQALAAAVQAVLGFDDPSTDTAPSAAQINALVAGQTVGGNTLGANAVSADALAAVRAAIDAANSDGTAIASQQELAQVVQTALTAYSQALGVIAEMAEAGSATSTTPSAQTYADAGVIGVSSANLAVINQALNRALDVGTEYGRARDLQAIVNSCNTVLGEANGALPDASPGSDPSADDYLNMGADIGLAETDAENLSLLNDIVGGRSQADVDTFSKIENLARIANGIQAVAAGQGGSVRPALTEVDFARIGVVGVTANNLPALLAAIAAQADSGADTDTVGKLQAVVDNLGAGDPVFSSSGTGAAAENTTTSTVVYDATADADTGVTYTFAGGADDALFDINASTGEVTFKASPNFEAPTDAGADNVYNITVRATNAAGRSTDQAVAIHVSDVNESPVLDISGSVEYTEFSWINDTNLWSGGTEANRVYSMSTDNTAIDFGSGPSAAGTAQLEVVFSMTDDSYGGSATAPSFCNIYITSGGVDVLYATITASTTGYANGSGQFTVTYANGATGTLNGTSATQGDMAPIVSASNRTSGDRNFNGEHIHTLLIDLPADVVNSGAVKFEYNTQGTDGAGSASAGYGTMWFTDVRVYNHTALSSNTGWDGHYQYWSEGSAAASVVTPNIRISDVDANSHLESATVTLSNRFDGDQLTVNGSAVTDGASGTISANGTTLGYTAAVSNGAVTITLSGTSSAAAYQAALRQIGYISTSQNPDTSVERNIEITVNDGVNNSNTAVNKFYITAINDRPTTTQASVTLAAVDEDAAANSISGSTVTSLFASAFADVDGHSLAGVMLTGNAATAGQGSWQWNNAGSWTNIATNLSVSNALWLSASTELRFVPAADYSGTPGALTARVADSTIRNLANGSTHNIDASSPAGWAWDGPTDALSNTSVTLGTSISGVNDAPVLQPSTLSLSAISQNATIPEGAVGKLVSSLVLGISDADGPNVPNGIAITSVDANGTLYFSTDGGAVWTAVSGVSATRALLLSSDVDNRVYFQPNAGFVGNLASAFTLRAWDQTSGSEGSYTDPGAGGSVTAFSLVGNAVGIDVIEATPPTVNITNNATGPVTSGTVTYTFTFSKDVTGFSADDVVINAGTKGTFTQVSASQYTLVVNALVGIGFQVVDVTHRGYTDLAGNVGANATAKQQAYLSNTISMGTWGGQLLAPVQVEGNWYYVWDVNGNGTHDSSDIKNMDQLEQMFFGNSVGVVMTESNRTMTLANGVQIMLPTDGVLGSTVSQGLALRPGTPVNSPTQSNPTYDDLFAIWDAFNGSDNGTTNIGGRPPGWLLGTYWSATPWATGHVTVGLNSGFANESADTSNFSAVFQVVSPEGLTCTLSTTAPSYALSTVAGAAGNSAGETITLTLSFNGPVFGLTSGSNNTVFTVAGAGVAATWAGTDGSSTRTLTYTVQAGQNGQAAINEAALKTALAAGISNAVGNAFSYTANGGNIPNIDSTPLPVIDTTSPLAPVVLDLNRDGTFSYTSQWMDVNTDGQLDYTAWAGAQDGVLVWDKLGDAWVHDQSQYAFSQRAGQTDLQGLAEVHDSNHDAVFDAADAQFAQFAVWQDANGNGVSDAGEVKSLSEWGITSIHLVSDGVVRTPAAGVTEAGHSSATLADGSTMAVADVTFAYMYWVI